MAMMVSAHFCRLIPDLSVRHPQLYLLIEAAPAFFFFAFGMTFDFYHRKPVAERVVNNLFFIAMALLHNLFLFQYDSRMSILVFDFLFSLFVIRLLIDLIQSQFKHADWLLMAGCVASLLYAALVPRNTLFLIQEQIIPGYYQPLNWSYFVLAGVLYQRYLRGQNRQPFLWLLIATAILLVLQVRGLFPGGVNWHLRKGPPDFLYLAAFSTLSAMLVQAAQWLSPLFHRIKPFHQTVVFFSRNLLLATLLHYFIYPSVQWVVQHYWSDGDITRLARRFAVLGSAACILLLPIITWVVLNTWLLLKDRVLFQHLRRRGSLIIPLGYILLLIAAAVSRQNTILWCPQLYYPLSNIILCFAVYVYFEMIEWKTAGTNVAPPTSPSHHGARKGPCHPLR